MTQWRKGRAIIRRRFLRLFSVLSVVGFAVGYLATDGSTGDRALSGVVGLLIAALASWGITLAMTVARTGKVLKPPEGRQR